MYNQIIEEQKSNQKNQNNITHASQQLLDVFSVNYKILHQQFEDILLEKDSLREEISELKKKVGEQTSRISEVHKEKEQQMRQLHMKMENSGRMSETQLQIFR